MADHQRIHPTPVQRVTDLESQQKPTAPLVPKGSSKSDNTHPIEPFPPYKRTIPVHYSKPPTRRSCCTQFLCWALFLILILVISVGILAAIVYFGFDPKIPKYSVDGMTVTRFGLNDTSLYAQFNVNITARNPNSKIGIYYENGSKLRVSYMGTNLCEGSLPKFYQGHKNTTVLDVALTGQTHDASGLMNSLLAQQQTGSVPLVLRVRVPVRIKFGKLKLPKWKPVVRCRLDVNSLSSTDNVIRIRDSSCSFKFRL